MMGTSRPARKSGFRERIKKGRAIAQKDKEPYRMKTKTRNLKGCQRMRREVQEVTRVL